MIKTHLTFVAVILLLAGAVIDVTAKDWQGIVPLRSTKSQVQKLLGNPNELGRYEIGNQRVSILYSEGPCESSYQLLAKPNCECLVGKDTVLRITVTFDLPVKVANFSLDKSKYERTVVYGYRPTATYADFADGIVYTIRESDDVVTNIDYLPSAKDCAVVIKDQTQTTAPNVWRGIVPLRSVRADVEKLLGTHTSSIGGTYIYATAENRVDVTYSDDPCKTKDSSAQATTTAVVVKVAVSPRKTLLVQNLNLDKAKYRRIPDTHPANSVQYINTSEGVIVEALSINECEEVIRIVFEPTASDRELLCGAVKKP